MPNFEELPIHEIRELAQRFLKQKQQREAIVQELGYNYANHAVFARHLPKIAEYTAIACNHHKGLK
jgi:hypothetical protein